MTIEAWLKQSTHQLATANVPTARLDCLILLEDVLNTNRTQILAHPEHEITEVAQQKLDIMIAKRAKHVPLAYLRKKTEFYGREFKITSKVLEPRPESETIIEVLKQNQANAPKTIVDIGTGSGALAITAALELPGTTVYATDIDANCLAVTKTNAKLHGLAIDFYQGDLLAAVPTKLLNQPLTLLCNLPYVPDDFRINTAATHEPRLAIFGGKDGLDYYRRLFEQLSATGTDIKYQIYCESLPPQHKQLAQIAKSAGFSLATTVDFIQLFVRGY